MPEVKNISSTTSIIVSGSSLSIFTEYNDNSYPNITSAFIGEGGGSQDSVSYSYGESVVQAKNSPTDIDYYIDESGQLVLIGDGCELKGYSINVNGELIYQE